MTIFAKQGEYEPCGIFTKEHFLLILLTIIGIKISLKKTINKTHKEVKQIIKKCTIVMWIFEVIIVLFKVITGGIKNINNYVPLYYCSLLLYAGLLSSFAKNELKRMGDVFLATGGIIGGIVFILYPSTSLPTYPAIHIVSLHSFVFHGIIVYLGLLINKTKYIEIQSSDIKYYIILVGSICVLAYIVNNIFGSNLMFISKNFPGTPIEIIYNISGKYFTLIMSLGQMILPFYIVYEVVKQMEKNEKLKEQVVLEIKS
ncbi:MAG: YwaF family protein [Clostridia bacterium]